MSPNIKHIENQTNSTTSERKRYMTEDLVGFVIVSTVSVAAVFLLAALYSGFIDAMMKYNSLDLLRGFGGVL